MCVSVCLCVCCIVMWCVLYSDVVCCAVIWFLVCGNVLYSDVMYCVVWYVAVSQWCVFVYINKSFGFGAFKKVFLVVDLGQWWSVVCPQSWNLKPTAL